jgi:hypothetical protein
MGWATFWAIFSQTHLVTRVTNEFRETENWISFRSPLLVTKQLLDSGANPTYNHELQWQRCKNYNATRNIGRF